MESLARSLDEIDGGAALDIDELAVLLRGLGEYKGRASGDYGRFLQLWTGAPWSFTRVGAGGKPKNAINLHIPQPTLTIVGGLQPQLHELLGGEEDGMRPRWLPFLATMPDAKRGRARDRMPTGWRHLIDELLSARMRERASLLSDAAIDAFWSHRERWKRQAQKLRTRAPPPRLSRRTCISRASPSRLPRPSTQRWAARLRGDDCARGRVCGIHARLLARTSRASRTPAHAPPRMPRSGS